MDTQDRITFLDAIGEMSERFDVEVFAYVLMSNHYHLLARTHQANLKKAMHWFGTTYTQRFNRRHFRHGHLFQGRYKSIIVENDAYMLQLSYYIHRNPLRSEIVKRLADYPWSSYRTYAYGRKSPKWLSTELILSQFWGMQDIHKGYREKAQEYANEENRALEDLRHGLLLGSKNFAERIRKHYLPSKLEVAIPQQHQVASDFEPNVILGKAERALKCDFNRFVHAGRLSGGEKDTRDLLLYAIWKTGKLRNDQIGALFGVTYSAVSHVVNSVKVRLKKDQEIQTKFNHINSLFKL